ncbi:MAG: hypothetical protein Q4C57_12125 [Bacillota bacterium]|nr:hypothetical protein [Bacillota bacterium]
MNKQLKWMLLAGAAGCILCPGTVMALDGELGILDVTATSVLPASGYGDYDPWNLVDYSNSTAWVENVSGNGEGESVTFTLPEGTVVTGGTIVNGYCKEESLFYKNSAPQTLICRVGDQQFTIDLSAVADDYYAAKSGYEFTLPSPVETTSITFSIGSVRGGYKYTDTCISELHLCGHSNTPGGSASGGTNIDPLLAEYGVTEDLVMYLASEGTWLYEHHKEGRDEAYFALTDENLTSDDKAFLAYWYQYHFTEDPRVLGGTPSDEYNAVTRSDLASVITDLTGSCTETEVNQYAGSYAQMKKGDMLAAYGTGDFGSVGEYLFENPAAVYQEDRLKVSGTVTRYDRDSGKLLPYREYTIWYQLPLPEVCRIPRLIKLEVTETL